MIRARRTNLACERLIDMWYTCFYALSMTRMIQIRNVPRELHAALKARAALAGQSLSDYLLHEVQRFAARPTELELVQRLANRTPVRPRISPARAVRAERDRN